MGGSMSTDESSGSSSLNFLDSMKRYVEKLKTHQIGGGETVLGQGLFGVVTLDISTNPPTIIKRGLYAPMTEDVYGRETRCYSVIQGMKKSKQKHFSKMYEAKLIPIDESKPVIIFDYKDESYDAHMRNIWKKMEAEAKFSYEIRAEYKGITLGKMRELRKNDKKQKPFEQNNQLYFNVVLQLLVATEELDKVGLVHDDIHANNVTFQMTPNNEQLISLIDYGSVYEAEVLDREWKEADNKPKCPAKFLMRKVIGMHMSNRTAVDEVKGDETQVIKQSIIDLCMNDQVYSKIAKVVSDMANLDGTPYGPLKDEESNITDFYYEIMNDLLHAFDKEKYAKMMGINNKILEPSYFTFDILSAYYTKMHDYNLIKTALSQEDD